MFSFPYYVGRRKGTNFFLRGGYIIVVENASICTMVSTFCTFYLLIYDSSRVELERENLFRLTRFASAFKHLMHAFSYRLVVCHLSLPFASVGKLKGKKDSFLAFLFDLFEFHRRKILNVTETFLLLLESHNTAVVLRNDASKQEMPL